MQLLTVSKLIIALDPKVMILGMWHKDSTPRYNKLFCDIQMTVAYRDITRIWGGPEASTVKK